jgi:hypothetical protein
MPPTTDKGSAELIVDEIRRQVDHQVMAASSADTKATALFAGTATVATLILPRIGLTSANQAAISFLALASLVAALGCFIEALRPRTGKFSYGPSAAALGERVGSAPDELQVDLAESFVAVRARNEGFLRIKASATTGGLYFLIATLVGMAALAGLGAIK